MYCSNGEKSNNEKFPFFLPVERRRGLEEYTISDVRLGVVRERHLVWNMLACVEYVRMREKIFDSILFS